MKLLDLTEIKAAIFDLNGTIIDDMVFHRKAWIEFCKRHGIKLTEEEFLAKFSGKNNKEILPALFQKELSDEKIQGLANEKEAIYREIYTPFIKEVPGCESLINKLKSRSLRLAVATTAVKDNRDFVLKALDLEKNFELIMGDEHVSKGKPDPEIYLTTANKLDINPSLCVVFEDTPSGVKAGKAAGMKVVGILTTHSEEDLSAADIQVKDYNQIELK
jgi:beta-phosphoglucomutase family hydrolase